MIRLILLFALLMAPAVNMEARDFSVGSFEELTNAIRNASNGDRILIVP